jgi:acyl-CoA reductase-like NAD-dependent aldehyde dehydrogenase
MDVLDIDGIFIGGSLVPPASDERVEVFSPHDGTRVGSLPAATAADVDAAVAAARRAFDDGPWSRMKPAERQAVVRRFLELYKPYAEELAQLVTRQNGIIITINRMLMQICEAQSLAYLQAAEAFGWEEKIAGQSGGPTLWRREPVGVVAAVIPWNSPQQSALVKIFPALLAGCTVILKTAPETPLDALTIGRLFTEAGLPEGVLSIVTAHRDVSEYLVAHQGVDKVAFTGSTAAGKKIGSICGSQIKRCSLELGGKSAAIVLPDADFDLTVGALRYGSFFSSGQACIAQTRILVPRARHDEFMDNFLTMVGSMKVGDPLDPDTFIGPLAAERQRVRVTDYIELGRKEGATIAIGGAGRPEGLDQGAYVRPTVFTGVDNQMRIAREEIFGPVVCVLRYDDVDEAVRIANDSDYGLSGAVYSQDVEKGLDVARRIRSGYLNVNGVAGDFLAPFGGFKQSGIGREMGSEGLKMYVEMKSITY